MISAIRSESEAMKSIKIKYHSPYDSHLSGYVIARCRDDGAYEINIGQHNRARLTVGVKDRSDAVTYETDKPLYLVHKYGYSERIN